MGPGRPGVLSAMVYLGGSCSSIFARSGRRTSASRRSTSPEAFAGDRDSFRVVAPVALAFDIFKDKDQFRLVGRVQTTLELPCSRCLEPFTWPVDAAFDLRYQPHTANTGEGRARNRRGRSDDGVLRERRDRPRPADARAVLSGAADEAAVPRGLPGPVPGLRHEPESRHVRRASASGKIRGSRCLKNA